MAPSKAPEAPLSEATRIWQARRQAGLQQAKELKAADVGFFGEPAVVALVPPDPAVEEPPLDEPMTDEAAEDAAAFKRASAATTPAPFQPAAEARPGFQPVVDLDAPIKAAEASAHEALGLGPEHEVVFESEPLGPDSFGGEDGMPAPSAETLRRQIAEDQELLVSRATESSPEPASEEAPANPEGSEALTSPAESPAFSLFGHNLFGDEVMAPSSGPLSLRFKLPPFTVFDARQGIWQDRKRAWLSLGIQSEVGRGENLLKMSDTVLEPDPEKRAAMQAERETRKESRAFGQDFRLGAQADHGGDGKSWDKKEKAPAATAVSQRLAPGGGGGGAWLGGPKTASSSKFQNPKLDRTNGIGTTADPYRKEGEPVQGAAATGTSIFDPALTELLYSWFVPPAGVILDPFAGGSVRGIVAAKLGRRYVGIELRPEQIAANEAQAAVICAGDAQQPLWIAGDAQEARALTDGVAFDFVMACPPYGDLERYSDDPRDLSTMSYDDFCVAYQLVINAAVALLKPDRFACYVIGDIRDEKGFYRGLPEFTVQAFETAGAHKYNEGILVTAVGSLPIRIGKQFDSGRKLGKTHQNILVFVKGDPKKAAEACNGQMELPA